MGRVKRRLPPFVMIRKDLLRNPVWRKLSPVAMVLYLYLRSKFNSATLSEVTLTYSEMGDIMSSKTQSRAFKELEAAGFIIKTKQGGLFGGACKYRFTGEFAAYSYKGYLV